MGTETVWGEMYVSQIWQVIVKLNNPLMGTETRTLAIYKYH